MIEMKKHILYTLLLVVVTSFSATAQKKPFRGITFSRHNFVDTVKIKIWDGAVIIPVEINGQTRHLMFDTGAEFGFWIGDEEGWMKASGDTLSVTDSQKSKLKKAFLIFPPIKMGDVVVENYPMVVDKGMSDYVCDRIDGAFGYDLVARGLSFKFDTKDSLMIVTDRKNFFSKEEKGQPTLKYLRCHKTRPMVWVQFPFGPFKLLFDSGAIGGEIDLSEDFVRRIAHADPEIRQKLDAITVRKDTTVITEAGLFGNSQDSVPYRTLHCPEIGLDKLMLKDVWISTDKRLSKIGSTILEHNSLIVNGYKMHLVLLPHDGKMVQNVGNENKKGLKLVFADKSDTLGVLKAVVRKDGEAYRKGIRSGDYLVSVNGVPITEYCTYLNLVNDTKMKRSVFRTPEGERKEIVW